VTGTAGFRPRRVVAVDLSTGRVAYPDPEHRPAHADARVVVRWHEEVVGLLEIEAPDTDLPAAVAEQAEARWGAELAAARQRYGDPPSSPTRRSGPLITVTVASFRSPESTVRTVRRLLQSDYTPLEVVVVDNDADPGPLSAALGAAFGGCPSVRWVHEPRPGLAFARNAGLAAARGSLIAFTDDDVLADRHWLARLVTAFDEAERVGCVTGAILPAEVETPAQAWLEEFGGFHKGFRRQVFDATAHRPDSPLYPYDAGRFGSGANMAFRTEVIRGLGGFAVELGAGTLAHGGEDLDIFRRTITAGHTLVYEPSALIWHAHRRSLDALRRQMFRYGVGLSATVTKWMLDDPRTAAAVLRRVPAGTRYLVSPASRKNQNKSADFPPTLTRLERIGLLCGPVAYLRSRGRTRRLQAAGAGE
jgi:GT2 family glycosyltransferase